MRCDVAICKDGYAAVQAKMLRQATTPVHVGGDVPSSLPLGVVVRVLAVVMKPL